MAASKSDLPYSVRFMGKPLGDLSREELIEACQFAYQMYEDERKRHESSRRMHGLFLRCKIDAR